MMLQQYKNDHSRVKQKLKAVMAFVKELYSEKDTLKTVLKVKTVAIEHAGNGQNWGTTSWRYWSRTIYLFLVKFKCSSHSQNTVVNVFMLFRFPLNNLKPIARDSPHKGQLYVFITGRRSRSGLGLANCIGCVCKGDRPARSITKYGTQGKSNKLLFTAEVRSCLLS